MYHQPLTKEEAAKYRYGTWSGCPDGYAYEPARCAAEIYGNIRYGQCTNKPGKGPDGLYCGIHAKKVKIKEATP